MRPSLTLVAIALCVASHGCGPSSTQHQQAASGPNNPATPEVISTVNGKGISKEAVRALMHASGWTATEALRSLQDELLLGDSAKASGYGEGEAVRGLQRQLAVQALLDRDIERPSTPAGITDAEIERAYRAQAGRFSKNEARMAVHVLARVDADQSDSRLSQEALAFIRGVIADLERSKDIEASFVRYDGLQGYPFKISAERLPPIEKDSPVLEPFKEALFSMKRSGVFPKPVRTKYGWHAIVLYEIQPASTIPLKEAATTLREEMALRQRKTRLETLFAELKKAYSIQLFEPVIREVLRSSLQEAAAGG
jgi:hypothetical protein